MEINYQYLPVVAIVLLGYCIWLDGYIWRKNAEWDKKHPDNPRHPYSPLFTALGVTGIHLALLFLVDWQYVAVSYAAFIIYGGMMWLLHNRRWVLRTKNPKK